MRQQLSLPLPSVSSGHQPFLELTLVIINIFIYCPVTDRSGRNSTKTPQNFGVELGRIIPEGRINQIFARRIFDTISVAISILCFSTLVP
jgi:hypothetical protein